ncbi:MAG: phosphoesterase [Flavobacterium psychrophilum]|nr:MAG: phosphoesterase [Flavobacterium psychrophilum]
MKTIITLIFLWCFAIAYPQQNPEVKTVSHTFYAMGNGGTNKGTTKALTALGDILKDAGENSTILFLGNNASAKGFDPNDPISRENINNQINILETFTGKVVFIPRKEDWNAGLQGLKDQEKYIGTILRGERDFYPSGGCGLQKLKINADTDLLVLDSQWAIMDWNDIPNLNDDCTIKTKLDFYNEIEHEIVKSEGKTVIIALYHPIASYGKYGNSYSFGINPQDLENKYYKELSDKLFTIAQRFKNIVFVSGHENNLQYIVQNDIPVIISGAAKTASKVGSGPDSKFSAAETGFAKIIAYTDGSVDVAFFGESNNFSSPLYQSQIFETRQEKVFPDFNEQSTPQYVYKSIYTEEELKHSSIYKALWGKHYRTDYTTPVKMKAALLDTLYGGLKPVRRGGGHQTNSLRLEDNQGREYTMRNAKKSALRFIQYFLFKTQYLSPDVSDTYFIELLQEFWTTANPYGALTIADLSDAIAVYHANTKLYYIPKQRALGEYNEDFGDAVYFIEEQARDGHGDFAGFGNHNKIIGTEDLIEKLERKDKVSINEALYIRTRLFDNVIGDFDRHHDQWRWGEKKRDDGTLYYSPIPRDRDQAYSNFDGFIIGMLTTLNPPLRFMQPYTENYKYLRWYSDAGDDVDRVMLKNDTEEDWAREARFIKENLTETVVDNAFINFPEGTDKAKEAEIKKALLGRIDKIEEQARELYRYIKSRLMITGTSKDDWFVITRKPDGITNIKGYRIQQGTKGTLFWDVEYDSKITKEIWLYGLEDKDIFEVVGNGDHEICIRIIGGQNNDTYKIENCKNIKVYDQKSKPNTFEGSVRKTLTDEYDVNTYNYMKGKRDVSQIMPMLGFNPDGGLGIGAGYMYTINSLRRNPFTAKHSINALYYTSTSGLNVNYSGEFADVFNRVNLGIKTGFTSPNFTYNFFGFGNNTPDDNGAGMDFNRVKTSTIYFAPSLIYRGYYGSEIKFGLKYENVDVEKTAGRFIDTAPVNPETFKGQNFYSAEASYSYSNFDNSAMPKKGISFTLTGGYTSNFNENKNFGYIIPELRLTTKIDKQGIFVYATKLKAKHLFNNEFEFYQAATIGDGDGLRGFRQQRFSGRTAYYQNSDLRISFGRLSNGFIPLSFGAYAGFDYGRVWVDDDNSRKWHTSQGGGLFFNLAGFTTANIAYFNSKDGGRLNIGLMLAF